jgi:hypothetical protein
MSAPLINLATLANHSMAFHKLAVALGFSGAGDIDRFIFHSYGKALREVPPADRPKGAIFLLEPPSTASAIMAGISALKPILTQIQTNVSHTFYSLPLDLSGGVTSIYSPTTDERKVMTGGAWPQGHAQLLSRTANRCVVWANGVGVVVFLGGDIYLESPDVVEELPAGLPATFQSLSWDDGAIVFEFARHKLNDTSPAGIWHLPDNLLLRPKPEKLMSVALGEFLRNRMAGYRHHDDEPYVENEGRADVSLHLFDARIFIVEVKWVGNSLSGKKELKTKKAIENAIKKKTKGWLTKYDQETFVSGAKQLGRYFTSSKYNRAYLAVFDCQAPSPTRKNEFLPVDQTHVAPHATANFRIIRACVDPRKASKIAKVKKP